MDQTTLKRKTHLTFASSFPKAVQAIFNDELVVITHTGDAEGMSPVYNVVDQSGQSAWVPQSDVKIIDQDYRPQSRESLDALTQAARIPAGSGSSSSR